MQKGFKFGLASGSWQDYKPQLRGFSFTGGGITQPIISDERAVMGRYLITNQRLVKGYAQFTFQSADALGSGETVWGISLPTPANRAALAADLPIGDAFLWQGPSATPSLNVSALVTLMDPLFPGGNQGQEDSFVQIFISKLIAFGTATVATGTTAVTVNHGLASGYTPNAYDIKITPTNLPATTSPQFFFVDTIGATSFNINTKAAPNGDATVAWKIEAEPNGSANFDLLVNHQKPWAWAAEHVLSVNFEYEARL